MRLAYLKRKLEDAGEFILAQRIGALDKGTPKDLEKAYKEFQELFPLKKLEDLGSKLKDLAEKLEKLDKKKLANELLNRLLDSLEENEDKVAEELELIES